MMNRFNGTSLTNSIGFQNIKIPQDLGPVFNYSTTVLKS